MTWYTRNVFCRERSDANRFGLRMPSGDIRWMSGIRSATRVEPEPHDLIADRWQDDPATELPDFLTISSQYVASDKFRRIVEELEPGLHQFIPVALQDAEYRPIESTYWFVNVLTVRDAVLRNAALTELKASGKIPGREKLAKYGSTHEFIDSSMTAGRHLWRNSGSTWDLFLSDELYRRICAAGLHRLDVWRAIEVDIEAGLVHLPPTEQ